MRSTDFYVDFESDVAAFDNLLREAAKMRLQGLALHHNDIDHAMVALTRSEEDQKPGQFQARVTVYARPDDIVVTQRAYRIVEAMDKALAEVERLIHERYRT
jgi:ribosome-associated translation inhibitor RaiA